MIKIDFNPPAHQLRQFAWISLLAFPAIGWLVLHKAFGTSTTPAWWLTGIGVGVFVLGLVSTAAVRPVFVGMMVLSAPIGYVVSTLVLGLVYYGLFTPVALFFKLTGRDKLRLKLDPNAKSYWVERNTDIPLSRYLRMY